MPEYHSPGSQLVADACCSCLVQTCYGSAWHTVLLLVWKGGKITWFSSESLWILFLLRRLISTVLSCLPFTVNLIQKLLKFIEDSMHCSVTVLSIAGIPVWDCYIHPKIYVREQSASWKRTPTKDIVIQRFVSRMKGQHQSKRCIVLHCLIPQISCQEYVPQLSP